MKTQAAPARSKKRAASAASDAPVSAPLAPRPRLLAGLLLALVLWVSTLLTMYFMTVYPQRYPSTTQPVQND